MTAWQVIGLGVVVMVMSIILILVVAYPTPKNIDQLERDIYGDHD
jgi:hypothetical protein